MKTAITLNADVGEGDPFDHELLKLVNCANISCGAHAGTEHDIRQAIAFALQNKVSIGAHPSYPDRENRGRLPLTLPPEKLRESLMYQLNWLQALVQQAGGTLTHVKPHGALYNDAARDDELAKLIADCVRDFDPSLTLVGLAGGKLLEAGQAAGLQVSAEAFIDRRYQADGSLVSRKHPLALINDIQEASEQALCLAHARAITAIDGSELVINADTLCIHGDSAHALAFAGAVASLLSAQGVLVR
ncbi:MAG: 5-oxoprolinase subunit PxpA [Gammaproteobacteria bacterium]|nr:5-oxoprolinase subunit PxpA [Gammaproteobacteria bacterium]